MTVPAPGTILISEPFMKDPNFIRTVVFLCEHNEEGSFGFVLNKTQDHELGDLIEGAEGIRFPVYEGGPVQKNTLHFLHQRPDIITGGVEVINGIYWGGDFDIVLTLLHEKELGKNDIRFFLGYSGWSGGQLNGELDDKSWFIHNASRAIVFNMNTTQVWKEVLKDMGGEYRQMVNYPIDPQLN